MRRQYFSILYGSQLSRDTNPDSAVINGLIQTPNPGLDQLVFGRGPGLFGRQHHLFITIRISQR